MDEPPPDFRLLRFSTDPLPPKQRLGAWRDVLARKLLCADLAALSDRPFRVKATLRAQHGLRMGAGVMGASVYHRTPEIVARDNDDLVLLVNLKGSFSLTQGDRELTLGEGDASLVSCTQTGTFVRPASGKLLCIRAPRDSLVQLAPNIEAALGRRIAHQTDPLGLLIGYVAQLHEVDDLALSPGSSRLVVQHIFDLAALAVGAGRDPAAFLAGRGVRAARLTAIKASLNDHLAEASIDDCAERHGISVRYVRRLFEHDGQTFTDYVTEQRLARAHAMLTSPRFAGLAISTIAFEVGFGDLSHFNRAFRRRYDATPSDVRARASEERQRA